MIDDVKCYNDGDDVGEDDFCIDCRSEDDNYGFDEAGEMVCLCQVCPVSHYLDG